MVDEMSVFVNFRDGKEYEGGRPSLGHLFPQHRCKGYISNPLSRHRKRLGHYKKDGASREWNNG